MRPRPIPPLLSNIVHSAILACNNIEFHAGDTCPHCGSRLSGYDHRKKRFAILIENEKETTVQVILRRSFCRSCNRIIDPPEPFYPDTRAGAPVVDLCRSLSSVMPYGRASAYLARLGVRVDRWSVRNYALAPIRQVPIIDLFGMKMPVSIISLSTLAGTLHGANPLGMDDVLASCLYPGQTPETPKIPETRRDDIS
jgi:hypothetical protein